MASKSLVFLAVTIFLAATSGAPNGDKLSLKVPEECKGKGFCHIKPEGYEEIEKIINSLLPKTLIPSSFTDRDGDATGYEELSPDSDWHNCPSRKTKLPGYLHSSREDTKIDIIVQTELLSQPIEQVSCAMDKIETGNDSQQCFQHLGLYAFGMKTSCETTNLIRSLLIYDPDAKEIRPKKFPIPCCCSCKISRI